MKRKRARTENRDKIKHHHHTQHTHTVICTGNDRFEWNHNCHRQVYQIDIVLNLKQWRKNGRKRNIYGKSWVWFNVFKSRRLFFYLAQMNGGKSMPFCDFPCQSKSINGTDCPFTKRKRSSGVMSLIIIDITCFMQWLIQFTRIQCDTLHTLLLLLLLSLWAHTSTRPIKNITIEHDSKQLTSLMPIVIVKRKKISNTLSIMLLIVIWCVKSIKM